MIEAGDDPVTERMVLQAQQAHYAMQHTMAARPELRRNDYFNALADSAAARYVAVFSAWRSQNP